MALELVREILEKSRLHSKVSINIKKVRGLVWIKAATI